MLCDTLPAMAMLSMVVPASVIDRLTMLLPKTAIPNTASPTTFAPATLATQLATRLGLVWLSEHGDYFVLAATAAVAFALHAAIV